MGTGSRQRGRAFLKAAEKRDLRDQKRAETHTAKLFQVKTDEQPEKKAAPQRQDETREQPRVEQRSRLCCR